MQLRAIETRYRGYRFRSRLEARWAVFFDNLGLQWEYEPEGFELPGGVRYLPDFYLPALDVWVEIKGAKATEKDLEKPRLLALSGDCAVVVYWGSPRIAWPKETGVIYGWTEKGFTEAVPCGAFCTAEKGLSFDLMDTVYTSSDMSCEVPSISPSNKIQGNLFEATKRAIEAARGSRFEHGEVPRV